MAEIRKKIPRNNLARQTKTSGKRQHIFMNSMELLTIKQYKDAKQISLSAAVRHLMMTGFRAEQMARTSTESALDALTETVSDLVVDLDLVRANIESGQRVAAANFNTLHRTSAGAYLASRLLVAKLDPAGFDRLDTMLKNYLSKLIDERVAAISTELSQRE